MSGQNWRLSGNQPAATGDVQGIATVALVYYTISVLSGLAATRILRGRNVRRLETELHLQETLGREL